MSIPRGTTGTPWDPPTDCGSRGCNALGKVLLGIKAGVEALGMLLTSQPVLEVMEPHLGQVMVAFTHHVLDSAESLVQAEQGGLGARVVEATLGDDEHVVEGEVLELG